MFGPNSAQSIEIGAELRRRETERWASEERLLRSLRRDDESRPSPLTVWVSQVVGLLRRRPVVAEPIRFAPAAASAVVTALHSGQTWNEADRDSDERDLTAA
jgi:hypothetical protein